MKDKIRKFEDSVSAILEQYKAKLDEETLNQAAYKELLATQYNYQPEEIKTRMRDETINNLKRQYHQEAMKRIDDAKAALRYEYETKQLQIERKQILARTGQNLIDQYARTNNLTTEQAREELEHYAAVKQYGFSNTLSDRYAAISNRDTAEGQDRLMADIFIQDELTAVGIKEISDVLKEAEYYLNSGSATIVSTWNTSGPTLYREISRQRDE